jgi:ornithine cyclodeaminase/alanine dehydrogenase-like protein (mu-crystallin family)
VSHPPTLLLTRRDVAELLDLDTCIEAVAAAFRSQAEGRVLPAAVLSVPSGGGGFHVKAAGLRGSRTYFAAKCNGNFPGNPAERGLPAIQGVVILSDGDDGRVLALLDSIEITILRTGAATAVAARRLARPDSRTATVAGCGHQGRVQLRALARVLPIARAFAFDQDAARATRYAGEMAGELGLEVTAVADLAGAARRSDVCVTCTPSRRALLDRGDVGPGIFVAAVGADHPDKQELAPGLTASATLVVDVLDQCAAFGDLHHALAAGAMRREDVHGELADVVAGRVPGRRSADEVVVFDSTGTAIEDVAAAAAVYERAIADGRGAPIELAEASR